MTLLSTGLWIAGICLILAVFTVVSQTLEQKRAEKRRAVAALERHAAHIQELLTGFPPGYLNKELEVFLYNSILETYEKLEQLNSDPTYQESLQKYRDDQKKLMASDYATQKRAVFTTPQEIKEMKQRLKDLLILIAAAVQHQSLSMAEARKFKQYLSKAMLSINLNSYRMAALQAESADKLQVAIHYHEQAKKLLITSCIASNTMLENKPRIDEYDRLIKSLSDRLTQQATSLLAQNGGANPENYKGRFVINDASDPSKKKQIYD